MSSDAQIIPEDIMKAAEEALDNLLCNCVESCGGAAGLRKASIAEIAKAILAERERCALIVEGDAKRFTLAKEFEKYGVRISDSQWLQLKMSTAIRKGGA
ncbi:hypothetical protein [Sinorhizobium medicae]